MNKLFDIDFGGDSQLNQTKPNQKGRRLARCLLRRNVFTEKGVKKVSEIAMD